MNGVSLTFLLKLFRCKSIYIPLIKFNDFDCKSPNFFIKLQMDLVWSGALLVLRNLAYDLNFSCFWDTWREIAVSFKKECSFSNLLCWNASELWGLSLHGGRDDHFVMASS